MLAGAALVTEMFAAGLTEVTAVEALFAGLGSTTADETDTVLETDETPPTRTTRLNWATPGVKFEVPQETVPVSPTVGAAQLNPAPEVCVIETKVRPAGSASIKETLSAMIGPAFVTVML